jgi:hypothetical protein
MVSQFFRKVKEFFRFAPVHNLSRIGETRGRKGGETMKEDEKNPVNWEVTDPKPPVIRSGHLENLRRH